MINFQAGEIAGIVASAGGGSRSGSAITVEGVNYKFISHRNDIWHYQKGGSGSVSIKANNFCEYLYLLNQMLN